MTGVQTCALPISKRLSSASPRSLSASNTGNALWCMNCHCCMVALVDSLKRTQNSTTSIHAARKRSLPHVFFPSSHRLRSEVVEAITRMATLWWCRKGRDVGVDTAHTVSSSASRMGRSAESPFTAGVKGSRSESRCSSTVRRVLEHQAMSRLCLTLPRSFHSISSSIRLRMWMWRIPTMKLLSVSTSESFSQAPHRPPVVAPL